MAITLTTADKALKTLYLDVIQDQLNTKVSPFLAKIEKTSNDVWGKEIKKAVHFGVNGGVGAGTEDGNLPNSSDSDYAQFTLSLKNLYGTIQISDKAIRASENNAGAFVSLLNAEMDNLVKSSALNFNRMLFGDGSGVIGSVMTVNTGIITVMNATTFVPGMLVDFRDSSGNEISGATRRKVISFDPSSSALIVSGSSLTTTDIPTGTLITVQGSYNNEITGLGAIFGATTTLYGLTRATTPWLTPYCSTSTGVISEIKIQKAIDEIEKKSGEAPNMILCSHGVRRSIINALSTKRSFTNSMDLTGGFEHMSYNNIPIVADRFCPTGTMYLLNTNDFKLHQLCDWQWLAGDDGKVLHQVAGKPVYTATLVKYADLLCSKPCGQGIMTGVTES